MEGARDAAEQAKPQASPPAQAGKAVGAESAPLRGQSSKASEQMRAESGRGYFLFPTSRQKMNHGFVNKDFLPELCLEIIRWQVDVLQTAFPMLSTTQSTTP